MVCLQIVDTCEGHKGNDEEARVREDHIQYGRRQAPPVFQYCTLLVLVRTNALHTLVYKHVLIQRKKKALKYVHKGGQLSFHISLLTLLLSFSLSHGSNLLLLRYLREMAFFL